MPRKKFEKKDFKKKNMVLRKRACRFCVDKEIPIDYKLPRQLTTFLTERGKLVSRRMTGNCAYHQRCVVEAVKRARFLALLPYSVTHSMV
ncbi:30S ribosomal protein S18 [bacterium]|nr:30S ribosomal protein S18 [bacterium]